MQPVLKDLEQQMIILYQLSIWLEETNQLHPKENLPTIQTFL